MKDRHVEDADNSMDDVDMNGSSTLVISESALSINGDDSRDSCHQLSIDTEAEDAPIKPSIRVAKGLTKDNNDNSQGGLALGGILAAQLTQGHKRKMVNGVATSLSPVKRQRPNATENDMEIVSLEKEVRALQWLARRKEQEWDQVISLLKQKEERLMKAQRTKVMIQAEAEHLLTKYKPAQQQQQQQQQPLVLPTQPVIVPQQQVLLLQSPAATTAATAGPRHIQPKPAAAAATVSPVTRHSQRSPGAQHRPQTNGVTDNDNSSAAAAIEKATKNLQRAAAGGGAAKEEPKKNTPSCQGCGQKKSEFVCAGCSNRWYCSRECQVEDWDEHADECSG